MALELKLIRGAIDDDLTYFTLTDNTLLYDAVDNPGGYGTPNPDRADIALYLYMYKHNKDIDDSALLLFNNNPTTVSSWQIPMLVDGYYYGKLLGFALYDPLLSYIVDDMVYHENNYYVAIDVAAPAEDSINNSLIWEVISDLTADSVSTNPSIYVTPVNQVLNPRAKQCYQTQVYLSTTTSCKCNKDRTKTKPYQKIFVELSAASFLCLQEKYNISINLLFDL